MKNNGGFSLIGLIIFMLVVGIALPPLLMIGYNAVENSIKEEIMLNSTSLAGEKMEDIKTLSFTNINSQSNQAFSGAFNRYNYSVSVNYVSSPNYDISVDPTQTNYKRVQVNISNNILPEITASLITIITSLQ